MNREERDEGTLYQVGVQKVLRVPHCIVRKEHNGLQSRRFVVLHISLIVFDACSTLHTGQGSHTHLHCKTLLCTPWLQYGHNCRSLQSMCALLPGWF